MKNVRLLLSSQVKGKTRLSPLPARQRSVLTMTSLRLSPSGVWSARGALGKRASDVLSGSCLRPGWRQREIRKGASNLSRIDRLDWL
jgi:hypothetical protein